MALISVSFETKLRLSSTAHKNRKLVTTKRLGVTATENKLTEERRWMIATPLTAN
jgi:hypothetical protein